MKSAEKLVYARSRLAPKETLQYQLIQKSGISIELSKDRRIEDLERQVRFLETRLMYLKAESLSSSHEKVKVLNELRQFYPLDELLRAAEIPRSTFYYHLKALSKPDKYADVKSVLVRFITRIEADTDTVG